MSFAKIDVANAGAGSGKTTYLVDWLLQRMLDGADPTRVVATTFTRAAAAQLKMRLQARVLASELPPTRARAVAEQLELANIGTVHAVGGQMLARFAIRQGLSPSLETLDENAQPAAFAHLLNSGDHASWLRFVDVAGRFGLEDPAKLIRDLIAAARTNCIAWGDLRNQLGRGADRFVEIMSPAGKARNSLKIDDARRMVSDVSVALDELVRSGSGVTAQQKAAKVAGGLPAFTGEWADFLRAAEHGSGKTKDVKAIVEQLANLGRDVLASRHLHDDVRAFAAAAGDAAEELGEAYRRFKEERGFVDFTDQESRFLELLRDDDLADALRSEIAVVAVDEFQDTNPIQLAIFQRLAHLAERSLWVGDGKQAIYGFRNADPELVAEVWRQCKTEAPDALRYNRRSCTGLVELVGRVFEPVLGPDAIQKTGGSKTGERAVERWVLSDGTLVVARAALAVGLARLRREGRAWGDIAVLVRTNDHLRNLASVLRNHGIPVRAEAPGLLGNRECAVALAGLGVAADPNDALAAATVLHLLEGRWRGAPSWFAGRLAEVGETGSDDEGPFAGVAVLEPLRQLGAGLGPREALQQVIGALDLPARLAEWGSPAQRNVNLDTMLELARTYEAECGASGGGATVTGLVAWLEARDSEGKDELRPPGGIDAVTVTTYHGAKGLEWKVVVLFGLQGTDPRWEGGPVVTGGDAAAPDPLGGREARLWPWPFGNRTANTDLMALAAASPEGQAAKQRETAEARRLLYVGFTRAAELLVIAHQREGSVWLDDLEQVNALLPLDPPGGWPPDADPADGVEAPIPGVSTACLLRHLARPDPQAETAESTPTVTWLEPISAIDGVATANRYANPSAQDAPQCWEVGDVVRLLGGLTAAPRTTKDRDTRKDAGQAVHDYLAALPSLAALDEPAKLAVATRCIEARGISDELEPANLVAAGEAFASWVAERYPGATWLTEAPITAPRADGGQWRGAVDLVLDLGEGRLVVIDHKSARVDEAGAKAVAKKYTAQIAAYCEALEAQGFEVEAGWVHFPLGGLMVWLADNLLERAPIG